MKANLWPGIAQIWKDQKHLVHSSQLLLIVSCIFFSCEKEKKGTCETSLINYQGVRIYTCEENKEDWLCDETDYDYDQAFYANTSCSDLGYSYQDTDGSWQYSSSSNVKPGSFGKWGDGIAGGGGSGTCSGDYVSPVSDAQLDAYCGAAYAYRCLDGKSLSDAGVQAVCQYYETMKEPGVPACSYCN